jgi:hypothetical protein
VCSPAGLRSDVRIRKEAPGAHSGAGDTHGVSKKTKSVATKKLAMKGGESAFHRQKRIPLAHC